MISCTASLFWVSVPVLSKQSTVAFASDSTALTRCTRVSCRLILTAPMVSDRIATSTNPCGTRLVVKTTAFRTISRKALSIKKPVMKISGTKTNIIKTVISTMISILIWVGVLTILYCLAMVESRLI